jgi:hypothetical protein
MSVRPAIAGNGAASSSGTIVQASRFSASTTVIGYSPSETLSSRFCRSSNPGSRGCVHPLPPHLYLDGTSREEQAVNAGTYKTLDDCKRHVEKTGGWCGHNCKDYGSGLIADCKPLLQVPKK